FRSARRRHGRSLGCSMRIWHWVITVSLLLTLSASAQQSANSSSSPVTEQAPESTTPSPAFSRWQPEPPSPNTSPQRVVPSASIAPVAVSSATMDQVVDLAIEREHALMEMLKTRTPLVETYLQNLKFVAKVGPT